VSRPNGFTLVELLVAAALMSVVVVYLTRTFSDNHRTYQVVADTTESQQNLRAIAALIERDARQAGFMVPGSAAACGVDNPNAPDVLYVSDAESIDPAGQTEPDLGAEPQPGTPYDGGVQDLIGLDDVTLEGTGFYDTDADGLGDSDFQENGGAIVTDFENPERGRACGQITDVDFNNNRITVDWDNDLAPHDSTTMGPESLRIVPAHRYALNAAELRLERNGQLLASDVEDVQVAFHYDENGDGAATAAEYPGSGETGAPAYNPGALGLWGEESLRELRINLVARTHDPDPDRTFTGGEFQSTENRGGVAGSDGFRRRVHTATVRVRNVGGRNLGI